MTTVLLWHLLRRCADELERAQGKFDQSLAVDPADFAYVAGQLTRLSQDATRAMLAARELEHARAGLAPEVGLDFGPGND